MVSYRSRTDPSLLPCPCCGGEAKLSFNHLVRHPDDETIAGVHGLNCVKCGLATPNSYSLDVCKKIWNTRP